MRPYNRSMHIPPEARKDPLRCVERCFLCCEALILTPSENLFVAKGKDLCACSQYKVHRLQKASITNQLNEKGSIKALYLRLSKELSLWKLYLTSPCEVKDGESYPLNLPIGSFHPGIVLVSIMVFMISK